MHVLTDDIDQITLPADLAHKESILTIGTFDGVHLGHQSLIAQLVTQAAQKGYLSGLVTFYPHPSTLLFPQNTPLYLITPGEKTILLEKLGLDWTAILTFKHQLAVTSPRDFIQRLYRQLNMRGLWVGDDFAFGHNREGNIQTLRSLGREMGFQVRVLYAVSNGGKKISSSRIRVLLRRGHVLEAARLLGRHYRISGEVIHGAKRGRCIGFPTANIDVAPNRVVPAHGIYATYACLGSERYQSVTNIGVRPSFDNGARSIEAHLLGFDRDIYGCDLVIDFVARLRPERRFHDVKDLVAQIGQDIIEAREILNTFPKVQSCGKGKG